MSRRADDNRVGTRRAEEWMTDAVALATDTHPHPNPRVGAIVLSADGELVAQHAHAGPGAPHAEAAALADAGDRARGGTLIVTLEPCPHRGHTAPCVDAIVSAGVARVLAGPVDPDPRVAGRGFAALEAAGVAVDRDVDGGTVAAMDPGYFIHRATARPMFTIKIAMTLDGQVAALDGTSQWITSAEARLDAHRLRASVDGVMVGAGTVRADDPLLSVRLPNYAGPQPMPLLIAGRNPLPKTARVYERGPIIYRPEVHGDEPQDAEVVAAWSPNGVDLTAMAKDIASRGMLHILVEGGPTLARSMLEANLVDEIVVYVGAILAGGGGAAPFAGGFESISAATEMALIDVARFGPDVRLTYRIEDG